MEYDCIIIGGGLGGLTAGAKLGREGKKILLVEQHNIPGGCATTYERKGFKIEVGLHEMDGFEEGDAKSVIFKELGIFNNVTFVKAPEFYRFLNGKIDITIPDNTEDIISTLLAKFPEEAKGIKKYFKTILGIRKNIGRLPKNKVMMFLLIPFFPFLYSYLMRYMNEPLGQFLDRIIANEDLKFVLTANLAYYHDDPYTMNMIYFAAAQGSYYEAGGYFIKGGSQSLSNYLAGEIEKNGGQVVLGQLVTEIIIESGKASGIKYRKTKKIEDEPREAYAKTIIANAAIPNVVNDLLPKDSSFDLKNKIHQLQIAPGIFTIYILFNKTPKSIGNKYYSTFISHPTLHDLRDVKKNNHDDFSKRSFVFVDYSQLDSDLAPEGKAVGAICAMDYISDWENLSREEYILKKKEAAEKILHRLEETVPGIRSIIFDYEIGTAKTIKRYTLNPGTAYGYAQIPSQSIIRRIPQQSPIPNLWFASAWTMPGGGFTGAIMSGYTCAKEILKR